MEKDNNGQSHTLWRKYEARNGRWTSPDPYHGSMSIGNPQSFNRYAYVGNDPVNSVDPLGLQDGPFVDKNGVLQGASLSPESVDVVGHIGESGSGGGGGGHGIFGDGIIQAIAVSIDETGGLLFGGGGGGDFFTPPVPLVPEPPPAPPQNPAPTQQPNPNCIQNAVLANDTSLARPFGNVGPTGIIGHDGIHVVAPPGSQVTTLPALTGTVIGPIHNADGGRTHIVDVLLDSGGFVALYKDLATVSVRPGQHLSAGTIIGTTGQGEGFAGLHFSLLNGGRQADRYYRSLTSTKQNNKIMVGMFTNPNGSNSPVRCPGVPVNNAGVAPHP